MCNGHLFNPDHTEPLAEQICFQGAKILKKNEKSKFFWKKVTKIVQR